MQTRYDDESRGGPLLRPHCQVMLTARFGRTTAMAILTTTSKTNVVSRIMSRLWIFGIESPTTNCMHNAYSRNWPNVHVAVSRFKSTSTSGIRSSVFRNLFPKIYLSSIKKQLWRKICFKLVDYFPVFDVRYFLGQAPVF